MKRRAFVQMLAAVAALPFLPKLAGKPKSPEIVDDMGYGLTGFCPPPIPVGTIQTFQYRTERDVPPGWLPCDGRVISRCQFPELAEILGSNKLPDVNERIQFSPRQIAYDAYCGIRYMIKAK